MRKKLLSRFVFIYRKWVIGECRHFCSLCEYKERCKEDIEWWMDLATLGYYENIDTSSVKEEKDLYDYEEELNQ